MDIITKECRARNSKRSTDDIICLMKEHGVKFEICNEEEAMRHLTSNNYFRISSYKYNFVEGNVSGRYANLDFAYLYDLSKVDTELRRMILKLCIDFEHNFKLKIMHYLDDNDDGYDMVEKYLSAQTCLSSNTNERNTALINSCIKKLDTPFLKDIVKDDVICDLEHPEQFMRTCPYWIFTELLDFGKLLDFYEFIFYRDNWRVIPKDKPIAEGKHEVNELHKIRELRNACAHNNCLIASLAPQKSSSTDYTYLTNEVQNWLNSKKSEEFFFSKEKKKVPVLNRLINLFYWIEKITPEEKRIYAMSQFYYELLVISDHKQYYEKNDYITSAYNFSLGLSKSLLTSKEKCAIMT